MIVIGSVAVAVVVDSLVLRFFDAQITSSSSHLIKPNVKPGPCQRQMIVNGRAQEGC
jgi:hypothetical protein